MSGLKAFLLGSLAGGLFVFSALQFHLVKSNDGLFLVPRSPQASMSTAWVDTRSWTADNWAQHPNFVRALQEHGAEDLAQVTVEEKNNELFQFDDPIESLDDQLVFDRESIPHQRLSRKIARRTSQPSRSVIASAPSFRSTDAPMATGVASQRHAFPRNSDRIESSVSPIENTSRPRATRSSPFQASVPTPATVPKQKSNSESPEEFRFDWESDERTTEFSDGIRQQLHGAFSRYKRGRDLLQSTFESEADDQIDTPQAEFRSSPPRTRTPSVESALENARHRFSELATGAGQSPGDYLSRVLGVDHSGDPPTEDESPLAEPTNHRINVPDVIQFRSPDSGPGQPANTSPFHEEALNVTPYNYSPFH